MPNARKLRKKKIKDANNTKRQSNSGKAGLGRKRCKKREKRHSDTFRGIGPRFVDPAQAQAAAGPRESGAGPSRRQGQDGAECGAAQQPSKKRRKKERAAQDNEFGMGDEAERQKKSATVQFDSDTEAAQQTSEGRRGRGAGVHESHFGTGEDDEVEALHSERTSADGGPTRRGRSRLDIGSKAHKWNYGSSVRISGLQGSPELNGHVGTLLTFDESKQRWYVRLRDGTNKLFKASNLNVVVLKAGATVRLQGLKAAPDLNGKLGVCKSFDTAKGRWLVCLRGGLEKLLLSANLEICGAEDALHIHPAVRQSVRICAGRAKPEELVRFVRQVREKEKRGLQMVSLVVVLCGSSESVRAAAACLTEKQLQCIALCPDTEQNRRKQLLEGYHLDGKRILVATDDIAEGIPNHDVQCVVNYDFPATLPLYAKRTRHLGQGHGVAHSLLATKTPLPLAKDFAALLQRTEGAVPEDLQQLVAPAAKP